MNEALREALAHLRRVYPHGVPEADYMAIIAVLADGMSEENVAIVVAELIDGTFSSSPTTSPQHNRFGRPQVLRGLVFAQHDCFGR